MLELTPVFGCQQSLGSLELGRPHDRLKDNRNFEKIGLKILRESRFV